MGSVSRDGREQGPGFEVGRVGVAEQGIEVVPDPDGVGAHVVGSFGRGAHLCNAHTLGLNLNADLQLRFNIV